MSPNISESCKGRYSDTLERSVTCAIVILPPSRQQGTQFLVLFLVKFVYSKLGFAQGDRMSDHSDLPFKAEYAKSGRASCKGCKSSIAQDSLRLAVMVQV